MKQIFFSNNDCSQGDSTYNVTAEAFNIVDFVLPSTQLDGNTLFIIDVHCRIRLGERNFKMQDQGGLLIYRKLLSLFKGNQEKLKVAFYSPLSAEFLVRIRRQNFVLFILPFVQCKYDGNFQSQINEIIKKYEENAPLIFNNASENLLAGWSLNGQEQIALTQSRKPLILDDQIDEWRLTYNAIFGVNGYTVATKDQLSSSVNQIKDGELRYDCFQLISNSLFVISDFYLIETHKDDVWKDRDFFKNVSGYILYTKAKSVFRCKPWMLFTSSNKVGNYELFDDWGIDKWAVKDSRMDSTLDELSHAYKNFSDGVYLLNNLVWLDTTWKNFMPLEKKLKAMSVDALLKETWWVEELFYYYDSEANKNFIANQLDTTYKIDFNNINLRKRVATSLKYTIRKTIVDTLLGVRRQYRKPIQFERNRLGSDDITLQEFSKLDEFTCYAGILYLFTIVEIIYRLNTYHPQKDMHLVWIEEPKSRKKKQLDIYDPARLLYSIRNEVAHSDKDFSPNTEHLKAYIKCIIDLLLLKTKDAKSSEKILKDLAQVRYPDKYSNSISPARTTPAI